MPGPLQPERGNEILDAALALLRAEGLSGVTMAALARRANCSKQTLYRLFEDRDAILAAVVDRQAQALNATLAGSGGEGASIDGLITVGAQLLMLLTSEASLAINRAALADPSGRLSHILIRRGKERSAPKIAAAIAGLHQAGLIAAPDTREAYRTFYGLLIADRQILALHGAGETGLTAKEARDIAIRAVGQFMRLYRAKGRD